MDREYYHATKPMRNYLNAMGFPYEKIRLREGVTTFRFELTPELQEALTEYRLRYK